MFAALNATNEASLRSKNSSELHQRICDVAVHKAKSGSLPSSFRICTELLSQRADPAATEC